MKSKYKLGWIGFRVTRIGRASKRLKRAGAIRLHHAELNNRNGFDWVLPLKSRSDFMECDWRQLADAGLVGIAVWFSDAQWGANAGITDKQWQDRAIIEADFNSKWPTGRRKSK